MDVVGAAARVLNLVSIAALLACAESRAERARHAPAASQGAEATPEPAGPPVPPAASAITPSASVLDAQIVRVADVLDTGEVEQGRLAIVRARDPRVQAFAQSMIRQHSDNLQQSALWQRRAGITPEESTASAQLAANAKQSLHALEDLDAAAFDLTFTERRVQQLERALDMLDGQLIPNATHPELRAQLEQRRTVVANHLADVRRLHASLGF